MKVFPSKNVEFRLIGNQEEALERLRRRTQISEKLHYQKTDRSFIGKIEGAKFKLISSSIAFGALCVLTGELAGNKGHVKLEIHRVFKVFFILFMVMPIAAAGFIFTKEPEEFSWIYVIVVIAQILMIRFLFLGLPSKILFRTGLERLQGILDFEKI